MVKQVSFFRRRPEVSVDAFQQHWRGQHADFVRQLPGLKRYVQNHVIPEAYDQGGADYDGVAEAWFENTDAMRATLGTSEYEAIRADEVHFIDAESMGTILCDEEFVLEGTPPPDAVRLMVFLKRRADVTPEFFHEYWRTTHKALAVQLPGHCHYIQNHCRMGIYATGREPAFDGIPMSFFDSLEVLNAIRGTELGERIRVDEGEFMRSDVRPVVITRPLEIELG